jgi:guanylate kinase
LLDIDLVAGEKFKKQDLGCTFLWIDVPSLEDLETRMIKRGKDSKETIALRMKNAKLEIEKVKKLEYY